MGSVTSHIRDNELFLNVINVHITNLIIDVNKEINIFKSAQLYGFSTHVIIKHHPFSTK